MNWMNYGLLIWANKIIKEEQTKYNTKSKNTKSKKTK